jgi:hypothetical protein
VESYFVDKILRIEKKLFRVKSLRILYFP